jgi:uncharacterized protein
MKAVAPRNIREKKARLRQLLKHHGRMLLAFSGGKDSFFLLQEASAALGADNVCACFVNTPFTRQGAHERLAYFQKKFPFSLCAIELDLLKDARIRQNSRQRCLFCKQKMFATLKKEARKLGIPLIADGSTLSDLSEHRPGRLALEQLAIQSPLKDAGFTSAEIGADLKKQGISDFYLTSSTCLATRFPYDFELSVEQIDAIDRVEHFLTVKGIYPLRVRHLDGGVRIETAATNFENVIAQKDSLLTFCKNFDYQFITLDLGGIKNGCWDKLPASEISGRK